MLENYTVGKYAKSNNIKNTSNYVSIHPIWQQQWAKQIGKCYSNQKMPHHSVGMQLFGLPEGKINKGNAAAYSHVNINIKENTNNGSHTHKKWQYQLFFYYYYFWSCWWKKMTNYSPRMLKDFCSFLSKRISLAMRFNYFDQNLNTFLCPCSSSMYGRADWKKYRIGIHNLPPYLNIIFTPACIL